MNDGLVGMVYQHIAVGLVFLAVEELLDFATPNNALTG